MTKRVNLVQKREQDHMIDSLETRRQQLEAKLASQTLSDDNKQADISGGRHNYALAFKLSSEFMAAIFVGAVLGYLMDKYMGTTPWGIIILLVLGFIAGVLNMLRSMGMMGKMEKVSKELSPGDQ